MRGRGRSLSMFSQLGVLSYAQAGAHTHICFVTKIYNTFTIFVSVCVCPRLLHIISYTIVVSFLATWKTLTDSVIITLPLHSDGACANDRNCTSHMDVASYLYFYICILVHIRVFVHVKANTTSW